MFSQTPAVSLYLYDVFSILHTVSSLRDQIAKSGALPQVYTINDTKGSQLHFNL